MNLVLRLYDTPGLVRRGGARCPQSSLASCGWSAARERLRRDSSSRRICALVLAGIVHLAPCSRSRDLAEQDAFSRLRATLCDRPLRDRRGAGRPGHLAAPPRSRPSPLSACAYNARRGAGARLGPYRGAVPVAVASTPAAAACSSPSPTGPPIRGALDLVVMTRRQLDEALASEDEDEPSARRAHRLAGPAKDSSWCACSRSSRASAARRGGGEGRLLHDRARPNSQSFATIAGGMRALGERRHGKRRPFTAAGRLDVRTGRRGGVSIVRRDAPRAARARARPRAPRRAAPR